jgi:hypothetical protein
LTEYVRERVLVLAEVSNDFNANKLPRDKTSYWQTIFNGGATLRWHVINSRDIAQQTDITLLHFTASHLFFSIKIFPFCLDDLQKFHNVILTL